MTEPISYGWTGKMLRVDLTTGETRVESTEPYQEKFIGGMGLANKIMYDEVPAGTDPFAPENKIVFAVGPLTASGVPMAGRTTICSLSTFSTDHLIVDAHCGGMIGAKIKLAGWDAIVIEGASPEPVYLSIVDDEVAIKSAAGIWGLGTRDSTAALNRLEGTSACVATIGPAGENMLPYANIINARNHSAGAGVGAVMGSKKCKALVVEGNGSVDVFDPQAVAELSDYMLRELVGSNNNHVVPSTQQEWAEYYDERSRWNARKGLTWGLAEGGPIDVGEPHPGEINTVGYRCAKSVFDLGEEAAKYTIKMNGCHSCPIHCYSDMKVEKAGEITGMDTVGNTCVTNSVFRYLDGIMKIGLKGDDAIVWSMVMGSTLDDLGMWENYAQLWRDMAYCITEGVFEKNLPAEEYAAFDWSKFYNNDPSIIPELLKKMAQNDSELAYLAHGPIVWTERWGVDGWFDNGKSGLINYRGWPKHHANEDSNQVGAVYNMFFNRDDMIHSAVNFEGCGLPIDEKKRIAETLWGSGDAIDAAKSYTPMNQAKAEFCWWSVVTDTLHDSLTLCNWVWPMAASPVKSRNYIGDLDMEAKFFKAVTGKDVTTDDLYEAGERIMTLQRANTMRGMMAPDGTMGCNDFRNVHDRICQWVFTKDPDVPVFTEGTDKLDPDDFEKALTMVYERFGWDPEKGYPTAATLTRLGLDQERDELAALGLI